MRSAPDQVHVHSVALVDQAVRIILETSFPLGLLIVTLESVIVDPLIVVGAENVTFGGKITLLDELFPAVS